MHRILPNLLAVHLSSHRIKRMCQFIRLCPEASGKAGCLLGYRCVLGADGIVFVLQPISTSIGSTGGGLGFEGITPSVGVTLDTWQNTNNTDPAYDHVAIQINGDLNHTSANNLAGPVAISALTNDVEDCKWHKIKPLGNLVSLISYSTLKQ